MFEIFPIRSGKVVAVTISCICVVIRFIIWLISFFILLRNIGDSREKTTLFVNSMLNDNRNLQIRTSKQTLGGCATSCSFALLISRFLLSFMPYLVFPIWGSIVHTLQRIVSLSQQSLPYNKTKGLKLYQLLLSITITFKGPVRQRKCSVMLQCFAIF